MLHRTWVVALLSALVLTLVGCVGTRAPQRVPADFAYPSAPEVVEYESTRFVRSLRGVVRNQQGDALERALVEVLSAETRSRLDALLTKQDGTFVFPGSPPTEAVFLRFSKPGFNTVVIRVAVSPKARESVFVTLPFSG
jgi:hypothetical protein